MDIIFRVLYVLYIVVLSKASSRKFSRRFPTVPEGSGRLLGNSGQNAAQVQRAESLLEESPISLDEFHFLLVSYCPIWYSTVIRQHWIILLNYCNDSNSNTTAFWGHPNGCFSGSAKNQAVHKMSGFIVLHVPGSLLLNLKHICTSCFDLKYVHYMYCIILSPKDRIV